MSETWHISHSYVAHSYADERLFPEGKPQCSITVFESHMASILDTTTCLYHQSNSLHRLNSINIQQLPRKHTLRVPFSLKLSKLFEPSFPAIPSLDRTRPGRILEVDVPCFVRAPHQSNALVVVFVDLVSVLFICMPDNVDS